MGRIVGIDLGTTYSAVAIPEARTGEGFLNVPGCPGCSVILDRFKRRITPSVVAEDNAGKILVGYPAKGRAGLSPEPIMFAKRWMGEDRTFTLARQGTLTPTEVAAHVLRYLKELAEFRLGEPVTEAVITVPAYFSLLARQMTERAGEMAGLKVAQIAQEPVAAALMYCAGDARDPLRLLTYDLGGGTFDVAILEKRDGVISTDSIRAFDGDRFLGGYDFDKLLALWLMDQLCAQGYELRLNPDDPADKVAWAKLMVYAEQAKIALSKGECHEIQEPSTGIRDHAGNPVALQLEVTRDIFEEMIRDPIEHTIRICHRARTEKARPAFNKDQFDEVLMVGGSSRIPLVARRLEEEFGRKPRLVEPDLCVALGAAILAGTRGKTFGCLKLDPVPAQTELPALTVTGRVLAGGELSDVRTATVTLRALDGSYRSSRSPAAEGGFVFQGVPLAGEAATDFALTVGAPGGRELAAHRFTVKRSSAGAPAGLVEAVTNVLSKPIKILLLDGERVISPERTALPQQLPVIHAQTNDTTGTIRVPILEEFTRLGEIVMTGIPATLPVGSAVEISLTIAENYQIRGRAFVPALQREQPVVIDLPRPRTPTLQELQARYASLQAAAQDAEVSAGTAARFEKAAVVKELRQHLQDVAKMLDSRAPDRSQINDRLDQVEGLVRSLRSGWKPEPSREVFAQRAEEAANLVKRVRQEKPEVSADGYERRLAALRAEADKAYQAQNSAAWGDACRKVGQLCLELDNLLKPAECASCAPPDPVGLVITLSQNLAQLSRRAQNLGRYEKLKGEFKDAADSLKKIDTRAADAMGRINDWYLTRYEPLREKVEGPEQEQGILRSVDQAPAGGKPGGGRA